jgi:putative peptidoglycan lipid II flippase
MPNDLASLSLTVKRLCSLPIPIKAGGNRFTKARSWLQSPIVVLGVIAIPVGAVAILRGALQAKYFGAGWAVDAFAVAQALALFLVTVVGASLGSASVPAIAHVTASNGRREANQFIYSLLAIGALKSLVLSLIVMVVAPLYVTMIGQNFDDQTRRLAIELVSVSACFFFFSATSAQISAFLNYLKSYAAPAVAQALAPAAACISLVLFHAEGDIRPLAWGLVVGATVQCFVLAMDLIRRLGLPEIRLCFSWAPLGRLGREYLFLIAAASVMALTNFVDLYTATALGPGNVAELAYGSLIPMLAVAFIGSVVSGPTLTSFSGLIAAAKYTEARRNLNNYVLACLALCAVPTAILIAVSPLIARLLFGHGGISFAEVSTITYVQTLLLLQIPFYAAGIVTVRMLTALQLSRIVLLVATLNLALKIGLNWLLLPRIGIAGAALSTSIVYVFSLCCCWLFALSKFSKRDRHSAKSPNDRIVYEEHS